MRIQRDEEADNLSLNLTPMIDVVFLLIIFFMVSTTFMNMEKEMDLNLPEADSGKTEQQKTEQIIINVFEDGRMKVGDSFYDKEGLAERLRQAALADPETPVTIRGDRNTFYQNTVNALDACAKANLRKVAFSLLNESPPR